MGSTNNSGRAAGRGASPISIAYFMNTEVRAGVENHVLSILHRLDRERFRLFLVAPPKLCELYGKELPADVEVFPLRLMRFSDTRAMRALVSFLRTRRIDILHSHLFYASFFASPLGRLAGVPVIVETPHVREQWRKGWIKGRFFIDRWAGRCVDHFIAVSNANARYLQEVKGLSPRKIVVIHNGRNLERFCPATDEGRSGSRRGESASSSRGPVICVLARLEPQKGHGVLLDALPPLVKAFPGLKVCFVGDGALRRSLEQRVQQEGLSDTVEFVGYQEDVLPWISKSDLMVLPSFYEGLPLVAIEALAMEKPVVATAVDGTPEVVLEGKTGLTVPPGDSTALGKAIGRLLADSALRRSFGKAGRRYVLDNFTEERQVARTEEFYLQAFRRRRHKAGEVVEAVADSQNEAPVVGRSV